MKRLDIREFLEQINEVRNVRGRVMEIVSEMPYLTQRVRALVRFSLSTQFQQMVPEKRTYTQILSALPKGFLSTSQVKAAETLSGGRAVATASASLVNDLEKTVQDQEITLFDDDNDPDPRFQLVACDTNLSYNLRRLRTRIGRQRDNDIVIQNERVSRHHAEIAREGNRLLILDQESRNGVWLNGWRISEPTELKAGDQIRIGRQQFTFSSKDPDNES